MRSVGSIGPGAAGRRLPSARLLAAVLTLAALLLVLAGMHAPMAGASAMEHASTGTSSVQHGHEVSPVPAADAVTSSPHPHGGTGMLDCLLFGVLCALAVVALVRGAILLAARRRLLRPHVAARSLRSVLAHLRVPDPPSPLLLSMSRT